MTRRWRVGLYSVGIALVAALVVAPIATRAAVRAAVADLRKHEKLDAQIGRIGIYRAGVVGVGVADIEIRSLDGELVASADAIALRPRIRSLRKRPGFWIGARGLTVADPELLSGAGGREVYDTVRSALRTLHRNFSDSVLVFRADDLSVTTQCGTAEAEHAELRIVSHSPHHAELVLTAHGNDRFVTSGDIEIFRDSVQISLTGSESSSLFRVHSQKSAPGWGAVVEDASSVSVVDETTPARAAPLAERLRVCFRAIR